MFLPHAPAFMPSSSHVPKTCRSEDRDRIDWSMFEDPTAIRNALNYSILWVEYVLENLQVTPKTHVFAMYNLI
ncbi:hypothetical protein EUTSA_v10023791mg [Eutrema salsugineum]|uniref:Uncharacterized protein n=1 Tax=Eutrema salsugineum TaxID=72664 RepID=V4MDA8_EUTSA|nr:hypothetical protein EUTSA_v10023791mg [Eutrema salsugineum]